jgi:hypothetical protein
MPEKLAGIRVACIEANPEIVELKFGCRFHFTEEYDNYEMGSRDVEDIAIGVNRDGDFLHIVGIANEYDFDHYSEVQSLGRQIRLADVLNAMWLGEFDNNPTLRAEQEKVHQLAIMWNLCKDDLTQQSPETIDFIHSLIA